MLSFLKWWLAVEIIMLATLPFSLLFFKNLKDKGILFSKTLGLLIFSFFNWVIISSRLLSFTWSTLFINTLLLAWLSWLVLPNYFPSLNLKKLFKNKNLLYHWATGELIFLSLLVFFTWIRSANPVIMGTEKPMDFSFLTATLRSDYFPPNDPWFAGKPINYYYFGHLILALLTRFSFSIPAKAFNLSLALIFALAALNIFSLIYNFLASKEDKKPANNLIGYFKETKKHYLSGFLGIILILFMGNGFTFTRFFTEPELIFQKTVNPETQKQVTNFTSWWQGIGWNSSRVVGRNKAKELGKDYITINEFPYFSFILGDLHAHVINLPFFFLSLAVILTWLFQQDFSFNPNQSWWKKFLRSSSFSFSDKKNPNYKLNFFFSFFITALTLGLAGPTNAWDYPIYIIIFFLALLLKNQKQDKIEKKFFGVFSSLIFFFITLFFSILLYSPFYWSFQSISGGTTGGLRFISNIEMIGSRTTFSEFLLVWLSFLFPLAIYIFYIINKNIKSNKKKFFLITISVFISLDLILGMSSRLFGSLAISNWVLVLSSLPIFILTLLISLLVALLWHHFFHPYKPKTLAVIILSFIAFSLIWGSEFFFIDDFFGPPSERMNTVFKLYYQAWLLLGMASALAISSLLNTVKETSHRIAFGFTTFIFIISGLSYPLFATPARMQDYANYKNTLDGSYFLKKEHPSDWQTINWIVQNIDHDPIIVEAVGTSYSYGSRISTFTGLPTVLGWYNSHESLWRNASPEIEERRKTIEEIYLSPDLEKTKKLLEKYNAKYIIVGPTEKETYPNGNWTKFNSLGRAVFKSPDTILYQVSNSSDEQI